MDVFQILHILYTDGVEVFGTFSDAFIILLSLITSSGTTNPIHIKC